jgi:hypothetical protein
MLLIARKKNHQETHGKRNPDASKNLQIEPDESIRDERGRIENKTQLGNIQITQRTKKGEEKRRNRMKVCRGCFGVIATV